MNIALVLSGGFGSRMNMDTPKQYLIVGGKPIIMYALETLEAHKDIDSIAIVAENNWQPFLLDWIKKCEIKKFIGFAEAGKSRQHSILNGLNFLEFHNIKDNDIVLIHDAARPCVSNEIIDNCLNAINDYDAAMPAISVKDTTYLSENGKEIDNILNRDKLFAGQSPEAFKFGKYYSAHLGLSDEQISNIRGSSELAFRSGMKVAIVKGSESNYKITTMEDLQKFKLQVETKKVSQ